MTLIHGAGVHCPSPRMVTYSAAAGCEAAKAVEKFELQRRRRGSGYYCQRPASWRRRDGRGGGFFQPFDLLEEAATAVPDHGSSGALEQAARLRRDQFVSKDEHRSAPTFFPGRLLRLAGPNHRLQGDLQILSVGGGIFVQNHQVDRQLLHPPVFDGRGVTGARSSNPSKSAIRTNTIGRSPEIPCAQSDAGPPTLRWSIVDEGRSAGFE